MKRSTICLVALGATLWMGSDAVGCPSEVLEAFLGNELNIEEPTPEELETRRAQQELEDWMALVEAISVLETGDLDERLVAAEEINTEILLWALDSPPDGYRELTVQAVRRLREFAAREPRSWIVYLVMEELYDVESIEVVPLLHDLTRHPAPSVRAAAIESLYNSYNFEDQEGWPSETEVAAQLESLWKRETHPLVRTTLLEALEDNEVGLPYPTLVKLLADENEELVAAAIDYVYFMEPDGWIDLLLRQVAPDKQERSLLAIDALTPGPWYSLAGADEASIRTFFERRVNSKQYAWARPSILTLLGRLDSGVAEAVARKMLDGNDAASVVTALNLLADLKVMDLPQTLARVAVNGEEGARTRALMIMASLPWSPAFDPAVERAVSRDASPFERTAAASVLNNAPYPPGDRHADLWARLEALNQSPQNEPEAPVADEAIEGLEEMEVIHAGSGAFSGGWLEATHVVSAPAGQRTVRCFPAPDCEGPVETAIRAPTGHPVTEERFDDESTAWLEAESIGDDDETCWVNASNVIPIEEHLPVESTNEAHREVDVAGTTLRTPEFMQLQKMKVLDVFDIGRRLAGCRITVDLEDSDGLRRLRDATGLRETNLAAGVRELLPEIRDTHGSLDGWEAWIDPTEEDR